MARVSHQLRDVAPGRSVRRSGRRRRLGKILVARGAITRQDLARTLALQERAQTRLGDLLRARNLIDANTLAKALADQHGLTFLDLDREPADPALFSFDSMDLYRRHGTIPWRNFTTFPMLATCEPDSVKDYAAQMQLHHSPFLVRVSTREAMNRTIMRALGSSIAMRAQTRPARISSGKEEGWREKALHWSGRAVFPLFLVIAGMGNPQIMGVLLSLSLGILAAVTFFRVAIFAGVLIANATPPGAKENRKRKESFPPPFISLIIALRNESGHLPDIAHALHGLDYPAGRLEALFVCEQDDPATRETLCAFALPFFAQILVAPEGNPRTKPRALNCALPLARGAIVGVYDAEDRPEPKQLRHVASRLAHAPSEVACLQARLAIHNGGSSWISRCFSIEYAMWFDGILKGLLKIGAPIPLGGSSVFFRRSVLARIGGWDAWNVAEDAEIGIRLTRMGYRCELLDSTTMEEATFHFQSWIRQRSRWIKGYLQCWGTHGSAPLCLLREMGVLRPLMLQCLLLGGVLFYLTIPLFWFLLIAPFAGWDGIWLYRFLRESPPWLLAGVGAGQIVSLLMLLFGLRERAMMDKVLWLLAMPLYWSMGTFAAVKALCELTVAPFYWDKTDHGQEERGRGHPPDPDEARAAAGDVSGASAAVEIAPETA